MTEVFRHSVTYLLGISLAVTLFALHNRILLDFVNFVVVSKLVASPSAWRITSCDTCYPAIIFSLIVSKTSNLELTSVGNIK